MDSQQLQLATVSRRKEPKKKRKKSYDFFQ